MHSIHHACISKYTNLHIIHEIKKELQTNNNIQLSNLRIIYE